VEEGTDGTLQEGSVGNVGMDALSLDELSCLDYLLDSFGGEGTIVPSSEFVLEVPGGLSVPDKDKSVLVGNLECGKDAVVCFEVEE